jgi:predicted phosphoadenosine phosphosulfate sulfurtransferase
MREKIAKYIRTWKARGYSHDIPDEVPTALMQMGLAPSYKAIAFAILKSDPSMKSLGFSAPASPWYSELKRIEIAQRPNTKRPQWIQLDLFRSQ